LLSSHRIWSGGCIWLLSNSFTKQADWLTLWERERERERERVLRSKQQTFFMFCRKENLLENSYAFAPETKQTKW
jgi:hypothetical protein